ncbi:hypothetical protein H5410_063362 [Solanum commersonii]|uniref:Uncharacterized protein n=1 Tax=Solanum commersonii TaxID=4109 RepID=A0A9J5WE99_SOLCO|nr:hypothetical protein H5410_063362 [Solanum commersonii]
MESLYHDLPHRTLMEIFNHEGLPSMVYISCVVCKLLHSGEFIQGTQSAHRKDKGCSGHGLF